MVSVGCFKTLHPSKSINFEGIFCTFASISSRFNFGKVFKFSKVSGACWKASNCFCSICNCCFWTSVIEFKTFVNVFSSFSRRIFPNSFEGFKTISQLWLFSKRTSLIRFSKYPSFTFFFKSSKIFPYSKWASGFPP